MFHVYAHAHVTMSAPMFHAYACGHVTDYEDVGARPLVQAVAASTPQGLQRYPYTGLHAYDDYYTRLHPVLRGVPTRCPPMNSYVPWLSPLCPPMNSGVKHGLGCACRAASQLSGVALHHL